MGSCDIFKQFSGFEFFLLTSRVRVRQPDSFNAAGEENNIKEILSLKTQIDMRYLLK
jgi:hypothetical protein